MRRSERAKHAALALLLLLGSCSSRRPAGESAPAQAGGGPGPGLCRVGPDGGPLLSDRGIGGTGGPANATLTAERGIGGTGAPLGAVREADRGIGGTGIIGVVTGFASVCLAGQEVGLDPAVPVDIDGARGSLDQLRAGQVAVIEASGVPGSLRARRVSVRHEVAGPIDAVGPDGSVHVAGQRVALAPDAWGAGLARPGTWVAVSGLRGPDQTIQATRLDPRPPGPVLVRGTVQQADGRARIGEADLVEAAGQDAQPGHSATVWGRYEGGMLYPTELAPDLLADDPLAYFGSSARVFVLEGLVMGRDGRVRLGRDLSAPAPGMGRSDRSGRAVLQFERAPNGSVQLRSTGGAGGFRDDARDGAGPNAPGPRAGGGGFGGPARSFEPAPVPDRSFGGATGPGGRGDGGTGPGSVGRRAPADGAGQGWGGAAGGGSPPGPRPR